MATRLYPPYINGTIPAFSGTTLVVPFSLNRAVGAGEIKAIELKMRSVNGILKETVRSTRFISTGTGAEAYFEVKKSLYTVGQHYKVQIAFIDHSDNVGYYSTVGVVKYTTKPILTIEGLSADSSDINQHNYYYTGVYSQAGQDSTEKMYSSRFIVQDSRGVIIDDTGYILHNSADDANSYESHADYLLARDLDEEGSYTIQFMVKTTGNMEASSVRYRISQKRSVPPEAKFDFKATMDKENGFVNLTIENCSQPLLTGTFLISRRSNLEGDTDWTDFKRFNLQAIQPSSFNIIDCSVAHGAHYTYAIQQYNQNGLYSEKINSNVVVADFEDAFLFDGDKQLRIRYNPKVSSFKTDLAEQKTETIGSQHPYIIRNGNVYYKEFPISGLISYKSDEGVNMFMPMSSLGIETSTTDLTSENIAAERVFKMAVLDWLNDGNPKLFRSPAEGNFIVRLMNVSLSPQDALGRMLHTFTATAYEVAHFNSEGLAKYNIIDSTENIEEQTQWSSKDLSTLEPESSAQVKIKVNTLGQCAYSVKFVDMIPGSMIYLDDVSIVIGATGSYYATSEEGFTDVMVSVNSLHGICTYEYKSYTVTMFGKIMDIHPYDTPVRQFIGTHEMAESRDITESIEDARTKIISRSLIRFEKRPIDYIYVELADGEENYTPFGSELNNYGSQRIYSYFYDMDCTPGNEVVLEDLDPLTLYQVRLKRSDYRNYKFEQYYVDRNTPYFAPYTDYYLDGYDARVYSEIRIYDITDDLFTVDIDDESISLEEIEKYKLESPDSFKTVKPHNGVITEFGYSGQRIDYSFDKDDANTAASLLIYNQTLADYEKMLTEKGVTERQLQNVYSSLKAHYRTYLKDLEIAIERYKREAGLIGEGGLI